MRSALLCAAVAALTLQYGSVNAVHPTDEYRDADLMQSSYMDNHNMDPNIVNSPSFGMLWTKQYLKSEQVTPQRMILGRL